MIVKNYDSTRNAIHEVGQWNRMTDLLHQQQLNNYLLTVITVFVGIKLCMYNDYISSQLTIFVIAMRNSVTKSQFYFYFLIFLYVQFSQIGSLLFNVCSDGFESIQGGVIKAHLTTLGEETTVLYNNPNCHMSGLLYKFSVIVVMRLFILTIILTQFIGMIQMVRVNRLQAMSK